jgi:hypothetical protein
MMPHFENGRKDIRVDEDTGRLSTSMTDMNAAQEKKLIVENRSNTWEIASATKTRNMAIRDWFQKQ